jgi:hypothetical protein
MDETTQAAGESEMDKLLARLVPPGIPSVVALRLYEGLLARARSTYKGERCDTATLELLQNNCPRVYRAELTQSIEEGSEPALRQFELAVARAQHELAPTTPRFLALVVATIRARNNNAVQLQEWFAELVEFAMAARDGKVNPLAASALSAAGLDQSTREHLVQLFSSSRLSIPDLVTAIRGVFPGFAWQGGE